MQSTKQERLAKLHAEMEKSRAYDRHIADVLKARKTPRKTDVQTENAVKPFSDLVKAYNHAATEITDDYPGALNDLATACVRSVLKKVIDPTRKTAIDAAIVSDSGCNPALIALLTDVTRDTETLKKLDRCVNGATRLEMNDDGDLVTVTVDPRLAEDATALISEALGDGLDLVNDAVAAILEQTTAQTDRDPHKAVDIERPFSVRRLKRKVWIKTEESVNGWETVETTPVQEVFRAIRRSIENSRAMQTDPRNGYSYLEDTAEDPETGETAAIYRRLPKYADLGGRVCNFNGEETFPTTTDAETVADMDTLIAKLNLTDRETAVIMYRLRGYGRKAIATALGTSENACKCTMRRIQEKATAIGLTV